MRAITREELKASGGPERSPSLARTSSATPDACPWVMSPHQFRGDGMARPTARFVAGTAFFNYSDYGSLRPGQPPIQLWSRQYIGFAIHAMLCGFAFNFFSYGHGRLLAEYLKANDEQQVKAANYVLVWPSTLSILIGLFSDSFSICGFRRKGYMVLGWMVTLTMCAVLVVLEEYSDSARALNAATADDAPRSSPFVAAYLLVSLTAAIGIQISWVSAIAASIEYAQREHIHHRGRHHGALLTLFNGGAAGAMVVVWGIINNGRDKDHLVSSVSIGGAASILAGVALVAIPAVVFGYEEARIDATIHVTMPLRQRLYAFWRFCHQNVVYRVLLFVIFHLLLLGIFDQNVRDAVQTWSGVDRKGALAVEVGRNAAMMLGALVWKIYLRNVSWHQLSVWGSLLYIASFVVLTTFTTFNVVRNQWFFGLLFTILDVPRAWLLLLCVHFSGEIADVGHEGVTVGLALSYQRLVALAGFMIGAIFPNVLGFKVTPEDLLVDSTEVRTNVIKAFFIGVAINVLCFPVIRLLPRQKLDAQQQRAFGGYNKYAGLALLVTLFVLVGFNLAVNLITVL